MELELIMWLGGQLIVAAAIWGGIRSDIKNMHVTIEALKKSVHDAHKRLDAHIDKV